jgi:hypothetical protein
LIYWTFGILWRGFSELPTPRIDSSCSLSHTISHYIRPTQPYTVAIMCLVQSVRSVFRALSQNFASRDCYLRLVGMCTHNSDPSRRIFAKFATREHLVISLNRNTNEMQLFLIFSLLMWRIGRAPNSIPIYSYIQISNKMQRYTVYLYLETALHVSGGTSTHHQERIQLYRQYLVFVTPLLLSAAIVEELEPG